MALLGLLSPYEAEALETRIMEALGEVTGEMAHLERLNPPTRALVYGAGLYEAYTGMRNDLVDILADDLPLATSDWHYCGKSQFPHMPRPACSEWTTPYRKA